MFIHLSSRKQINVRCNATKFNARAKNDKLHHIGAPAVIAYFENGHLQYKVWYKNGNPHRISGPSSIRYFKNGHIQHEAWYKDGKIYINHATPSITYYFEDGTIQEKLWYTGK